MQIPHEVTARPDTGLYNAKLGIWLFLASEVMLFGGLFSEYIFMRIGADPGYWPHGLLNVPVGMGNTVVLIASSVTIVFAWAALKMRRWNQYWWCMLATILCGILFLGVKLSYEWPAKFVHFGVYVQKDSASKYKQYLGKTAGEKGEENVRREITGDLVSATVVENGVEKEIDIEENAKDGGFPGSPHQMQLLLRRDGKRINGEVQHVKLVEYKVKVDQTNANPDDPENERAHFWQRDLSDTVATIKAEDIASASAFFPRHNTYFGTYFLITGLHGLHVLGGVLVFLYMFLFGKKLYLRNPEHMANRVEVAGLFWHFVDLVWIFVFPIFYLL